MTEQTVIALLAAAGVIAAAAVSGVGVGFGFLWKRISELEAKVTKIADREARIRWWALDVKDLYYRHRKDGSPDLPDMPEMEDEK